MTSKKTAFTAHIGRARTRIQQRARIQLKPCPLSDTILFYRTYVLLPLGGSVSAVSSFQLRPVFGAVSSRVPPGDTMSRFVDFRDKSRDNSKKGVRTLIQFLSRIILGGFLETAPRWLPARLDLAVIGCRIRPCRYNLPVGLGDVRMRPMLVANRLGMARCGCRNDRFCHAAKPAGSGR